MNCTSSFFFLFFNIFSKVFNPLNLGKSEGCIFKIDFPKDRIKFLDKIFI